ncbi:hypothetical protein [Lebetimonas sp. JH292]|nr:hypothetical protein [Lebetimonas sp. JH292]
MHFETEKDPRLDFWKYKREIMKAIKFDKEDFKKELVRKQKKN